MAALGLGGTRENVVLQDHQELLLEEDLEVKEVKEILGEMVHRD